MRDWLRAAGIRALKTAAQAALTLIGTQAVGITELDWPHIASVSAAMAVASVLTSIAGIPEAEESPLAAARHLLGGE